MKTKRLLTVLLCLIMALPLLCFNFGCGQNASNVNTQEMADASEDNYRMYLNKTFNSTLDAADVQGYNGWYYYCGTPSQGNLEKMCFQASSGRWCSSWQQLYESTYIWGTWLPDGQTGQGIGMSFMAPATGTMTVTVKLKVLCDTTYLSSNGVNMQTTTKQGTRYDSLCKAVTTYGTYVTMQQQNIKLLKGDEIMFMLYARSGNINCHTKVDISVNYTGAY